MQCQAEFQNIAGSNLQRLQGQNRSHLRGFHQGQGTWNDYILPSLSFGLLGGHEFSGTVNIGCESCTGRSFVWVVLVTLGFHVYHEQVGSFNFSS